MYGAVPYLMRAFALDRDAAFQVVCDWLDAQEGERLPRRTAPARASHRKKRGTRS